MIYNIIASKEEVEEFKKNKLFADFDSEKLVPIEELNIPKNSNKTIEDFSLKLYEENDQNCFSYFLFLNLYMLDTPIEDWGIKNETTPQGQEIFVIYYWTHY